jgi:hypothetical protein
MKDELEAQPQKTDRRWEQGEDHSLVDFKVHEFRKAAKMGVAEASDRKRWKKAGVRQLMRNSGLSQKVSICRRRGRTHTRFRITTCLPMANGF